MILYVKYCGGCNPRFERSLLVARITSELPEVKLMYTPDSGADAAVIICGCGSACADRTGAIGTYGTFVIWQNEQISELFDFLKQVIIIVNRSEETL